MGAQSVGYLEAWGLWWRGVDLKPMRLYGFPMLWVGRIAKFLGFVAGLTVILDLVGAEKAEKLGLRNLQRIVSFDKALTWATRISFIATIYSAFAAPSSPAPQDWRTWVALACAASLVLCVILTFLVYPLAALSASFTTRRRQLTFRWLCVALLMVSFSFDLLTS